MKVFLSGTCKIKDNEILKKCDYFLESFLSIKKEKLPFFLSAKDFLLDSGAFSFMNGKKTGNIYNYAKQYAYFVKEYDIKNFFELDIELLVGWEEYLKINDVISSITKKQSIPVFHKNRGWEWFEKMCKQVPYIAYGGIAVNRREVKKIVFDTMPVFISCAHKNKCKIHGLGFTSTSMFDKIKFDTIDSTTWLIGSRLGNLCYFTGNGMRQFYSTQKGKKTIDADKLDMFNFLEWCKFQRYADKNL